METVNRVIGTQIKKSGINSLRRRILRTYRTLGETNSSIDTINTLAKNYFRGLKKSQGYINLYKEIVREAVASGDYQRFALVDDGQVKMSLHVMPRGSQIPIHAHPEMFSVTFVDQGVLKIKYDSWGRKAPLNVSASSQVYSNLGSNQVSTGLPIKNNLHQIQAESSVAVFFSLRVKLNSKQNVFEQLFSKKGFAVSTLLMGFAMPFISLSSATNSVAFGGNSYDKGYVTDYSEQVLASEKEQIYVEKALQYRGIAEKQRNSGHYESQVEAVSYYTKAARGGDAESQYWLGVMYLDGSGITEDDDMALEWISRAANQHYQPAEKLLAHLIATDFDMEC